MVGFLSRRFGHHTGLPLRTVTAETKRVKKELFGAAAGHQAQKDFFLTHRQNGFCFPDDGRRWTFYPKGNPSKCFDLEGRLAKLASHRRALFVFAAIDFCRATVADKGRSPLEAGPRAKLPSQPFSSFPFN